ncbi:MAG: ATP-dependent zinc protease [Pseudomonadales bacterium]|nr:ATP-dependent zinc protease [Pseudomonadales bacterium]
MKVTLYKHALSFILITSLMACASNEPYQLSASDTIAANQQAVLLQVMEENRLQQQQSYETLQAKIATLTPPSQKPVVVVANECLPYSLGDKFILGEVEQVFVEELQASFSSRIDTGAESSSLDARNIVLFERDGKQWVRFDVYINSVDAQAKTFEHKVSRFVKIKTDAEGEDDKRPVIHVHLQIGRYKAETELNLVDRSHLEYPLLLGRKFMQDIAVVDVGKKYLHGKKSPVPAEDKKDVK